MRHILPGTISPIVVYGTMRIGTSIITAASLSFLGMGASPPTPEWGAMLNEARADMVIAPHVAIFPALAIFLTVLAFNLLGDGLRDALDPKIDRSNPTPPSRPRARLPARVSGEGRRRFAFWSDTWLSWTPKRRTFPASAICRRAPGFHLRRRRRHRGPCHAGRWRIADRRDRGAHARRRPVPGQDARSRHRAQRLRQEHGLVQVQELGVLETPIALTNTFGVGTVANAQIRAAVAANPAIGRELSTVNPLVFECNDGYLNDIQAMAVQEAHYAQALAAAGKRMAQGAVGAGRGMSCFSFKGGIGSASRLAEVQPGQRYTVGALVLANFGRLPT